MGTIAWSDAYVLLDSIAQQSVELDAKMGDGTGANTASKGAQNNVDRIVAYTDPEIIDELLPWARAALNKVLTNPNAYELLEELIKGFSQHVGGIDTYLTSEGERVAPEFKTIYEAITGVSLSARNTFTPAHSDMGNFAPSGAGAGTFTDGTAIDNTNYADADLQIEYTAVITTGGTAHVTLTKWDGTSETKDVTCAPGGSGTKVAIGTPGTDKYIDVANITITGFAAGENFKVIADLERTIAL